MTAVTSTEPIEVVRAIYDASGGSASPSWG